ncbi:MAG: hypothetical protein SF053_12030 [Bacteroidia bacterium]|nr:hypothetical protein [Bacteroidia bacterium]
MATYMNSDSGIDHIPAILNEPIFQKAFQEAGLANLSPEQRDRYEQSLIQYRDLKSALETAVEEREIEIAKNAITAGLEDRVIAAITGLSLEHIEKLRLTLISGS